MSYSWKRPTACPCSIRVSAVTVSCRQEEVLLEMGSGQRGDGVAAEALDQIVDGLQRVPEGVSEVGGSLGGLFSQVAQTSSCRGEDEVDRVGHGSVFFLGSFNYPW